MSRGAKLSLAALILGATATPARAGFVVPAGRNLTSAEIALSVGALVFAVIVIVIAAWLRGRQVVSGDVTFKIIGLAVVVGAALFLVAAGYSQEQITPIVGILGTALGFIFGRTSNLEQESKPPAPAA